MPTPYRYLRCGDLRSPGTSERRNGPLGLRDDDDDWDNPGIPPFVLSMGFTAPFWQTILHGLIGIGTLHFVVHTILIGRITKSVVTIMTLLPILEYDWTVDNERHMSEVTSPEQKLPNKMPTLWWCVVRKLNITK